MPPRRSLTPAASATQPVRGRCKVRAEDSRYPSSLGQPQPQARQQIRWAEPAQPPPHHQAGPASAPHAHSCWLGGARRRTARRSGVVTATPASADEPADRGPAALISAGPVALSQQSRCRASTGWAAIWPRRRRCPPGRRDHEPGLLTCPVKAWPQRTRRGHRPTALQPPACRARHATSPRGLAG